MEQNSDWSVIFDLGRVLFQWEPQQIIAQVYADPNLQMMISRSVFEHPDWQELDRGTLTEEAAIDRFCRRTRRPASELRTLMQVVRESLTPMAESWRLVNDLAEYGIPLYCLSNMASSVFGYLKTRYEYWHVFRGIVISGDVNMIKPERAIFEYICERYGLVPSRTVFVDDHPPNVAAAVGVGIQGIRFSGAAACRGELAAILGR